MSGRSKNFTDLQTLRATLQRQRQASAQTQQAQRERQLLLEQEQDLFRRSVGAVIVLPPANRLEPGGALPLPIARHHLADEQAALDQSLSDEFTIDTLLESDDQLSFKRNGISDDIVRKLRRGHWSLQAELDLHGLRTDQARLAIAEFLRDAGKHGWRCVRVIHGKGLGSIDQQPVLKNRVRGWLAQKQEVLAFCQAKAADGGSGALMVLLKKRLGHTNHQ